jgi:hypothetical protein
MALALVFCTIGMFLFGYTMSVGSPSTLCAFFQGVMMVGVLIGIFATLSYALDAFRSQSNDIFIMNMLFKNFMFYGLSNFANNWVAAKGPTEIMYVKLMGRRALRDRANHSDWKRRSKTI